MCTGKDGHSYNVNVLLQCCLSNLLWGLAKTGINNLKTSIAKCTGNNLSTTVMAIKAWLCN